MVALALMAYLLLPALSAVHAATDHAGEVVAEVQGCELDHHDGSPDSDGETDCDVCVHLAMLGSTADVPAPALTAGVDVNSPEYVFTPEAFCLPADLRATPASPRAPPRL